MTFLINHQQDPIPYLFLLGIYQFMIHRKSEQIRFRYFSTSIFQTTRFKTQVENQKKRVYFALGGCIIRRLEI